MGLLGSLGTAIGAYFGGPSGAAIGGSIGGGIDGSMAQDATNSANAAAAARQMEFQADMSGTAYQRAVKDMQAAGLNPMLAYSQGGASTPGGAAPTFQNSAVAGSQTAAQYAQMAQQSAQIENIRADTENKKSQSALIDAQTAQANATAAQSSAQIGLINASVDKVKEEIKNVPIEGNRLRDAAWLLKNQSDKTFQETLNAVEQRKVLEATARKLVADGTLSIKDVEAADKLGNLGREAGQLKPIIDILVNVIRTMK